MPQYLVAIYLPDDYDPSVENRSDNRGDTWRSTVPQFFPCGCAPD
jgi:hypothetical protein